MHDISAMPGHGSRRLDHCADFSPKTAVREALEVLRLLQGRKACAVGDSWALGEK